MDAKTSKSRSLILTSNHTTQSLFSLYLVLFRQNGRSKEGQNSQRIRQLVSFGTVRFVHELAGFRDCMMFADLAYLYSRFLDGWCLSCEYNIAYILFA